MSRFLVTTALLVASALPAAAQTTYAASADTLRFHEVSQAKIVITSPQGDIPIGVDHDATISVVRMRGDSARAWYDSLVLRAAGPQGEQRPATTDALKQPFRLTFDPRGRVRLVQAPKFPATFEGIADLSHQFDDFFLRLPSAPLRVGLAWSDTISRKDSTADKYMMWTSNADYRVERDTVVSGTPAFIVSMKQKLRVNGEGPVPNQPMRATTLMDGFDDGFFVFAPRAGKVIARRRQGHLEGDMLLRGAMGEMSMKQSYNYTSTLDAVR